MHAPFKEGVQERGLRSPRIDLPRMEEASADLSMKFGSSGRSVGERISRGVGETGLGTSRCPYCDYVITV